MGNEQYLNKITSQHKIKPKFMAWLEKNLDVIEGIENILNILDSEFDVYSARGKQQDVLGEVIGISRTLDFQPADGSSPVLKDDIYRILQLAKISMNQWDGTIPGVVELWRTLFPQYKLILNDNQDMSLDLIIFGLTTSLEKELITRGYIAPKPEGVRVNYEFRIERNTEVKLKTSIEKYPVYYNMCGTFLCGTRPYVQTEGISFDTELNVNTNKTDAQKQYLMTGTFKSGGEKV